MVAVKRLTWNRLSFLDTVKDERNTVFNKTYESVSEDTSELNIIEPNAEEYRENVYLPNVPSLANDVQDNHQKRNVTSERKQHNVSGIYEGEKCPKNKAIKRCREDSGILDSLKLGQQEKKGQFREYIDSV